MREVWKAAILVAAGLVFLSPCIAAAQEKVDVELVLAVDTSRSMTREELFLQRQGYAAAFRSRDVIDAIAYGRYGQVAVTYVEWGAATSRRIIVPWMVVRGIDDAHAFAERLEEAKVGNLSRTSISGAIRHGVRTLNDNGYASEHRVIDISGDGPNNEGGPVAISRDEAVRNGVTVNGLPLMLRDGTLGKTGITLDTYYADCVIGGPRAFILPVSNWRQFPLAVRLKLALELSGRTSNLWRARSALPTRIQRTDVGMTDCGVGEQLWWSVEPG